MSDELIAAIERVRASERLRVLVLQGNGPAFCVGDDIKEMPRWGDANDAMRRARYYQNMANQLEELDKITIAAVDGYAVGGGLELTMACDFVIATERSRWGMPEIDVGLTPGWGGTTRMSRLIGRRLTKEINMIGAIHPARRAVEWRLWNRVVPDGALDAEVSALIDVLRSKHQQGLRQMKFIINRGVECDQYTAQGFEALSGALVFAVNGYWEIPDADKGAGFEAFASNYHGTNMADIGRELGLGAPGLYNHIKSKQALLQDICVSAMERALALQREALREGGHADRLRKAAQAHVRFVAANAAEALVVDREFVHLDQEFRDEIMRQRHERARLSAARPPLTPPLRRRRPGHCLRAVKRRYSQSMTVDSAP